MKTYFRIAVLALPLFMGTGALAQAPEDAAPPQADAPTEAASDPPAEPPAEAPPEPTTPASAMEEDEAPLPEGDMGDLEALLSESVVTTASRNAERSSTAPASVMTITRADLERYGMRTLDEALRFLTAGVHVVETGAVWRAPLQIGARGILLADSGRHVLVLVDGHIMNAQATGNANVGANLGVPFDAIDHVEVMLGPASVVYGSNAMFAVIHVFTRRPAGETMLRASQTAWLTLPTETTGRALRFPGNGRAPGFGTRTSLGAGRAFDVGERTAEVSLFAEYLDVRSSTADVGPAEGSYFEIPPGETVWGGRGHQHQRAASVHGSARLGGFRLAFLASWSTLTQPFTGLLAWPGSEQTGSAYRLDLSHDVDPTERWHAQTRVYGDIVRYREQSAWRNLYYCAPGQVDGCIYRARDVSRSAGIEHSSTVDWTLDGRFVTTIGGDVRARYGRAHPAMYEGLLDGAPPPDTENAYYADATFLGAVYLQQVFQPDPRIGVNVGARLDVDSAFGARLSPRVAVVGQPHQALVLRAAYTEAFRGPSIAEVREYDPAYRIRSRGLDPEVVRNVEAEARVRFSRGFVSLTGFASFYTDLADSRYLTDEEAQAAMDRGELSPFALPGLSVQYANIGDVRVLGGTLATELRAGRGIALAGSFTLTDTRYESEGALDTLDMIPSWTGNARITKAFGDDDVILALSSHFYGSSLPQYGSAYGLRSSAQLELRGTLSGRFQANERFGYRTSVGFRVNPDNPVVLSPGVLPDGPDNRVELVPSERFHVLVGFSYDLDE